MDTYISIFLGMLMLAVFVRWLFEGARDMPYFTPGAGFDGAAYVLDGETPVLEPDPDKWRAWMAANKAEVAQTSTGGAEVTTRFTGIDLSGGLLERPHVFLTVGRGKDWERRRYASTWGDAEANHLRMVAYAGSLGGG